MPWCLLTWGHACAAGFCVRARCSLVTQSPDLLLQESQSWALHETQVLWGQ